MALRSLLGRLAQDPAGAKLIADGGRAFVSSAMRRVIRTSWQRMHYS